MQHRTGDQNAPLVIAKDRYDQHESHCTFKSVEGKDSDWKIASDCTVEGSAMPYDFTLTVSGDTLTFTDSGGARDFLRCKYRASRRRGCARAPRRSARRAPTR